MADYTKYTKKELFFRGLQKLSPSRIKINEYHNLSKIIY